MLNCIANSSHQGKHFKLLNRWDVQGVSASDPWKQAASFCEPPLPAGPQGMDADLSPLQKAAYTHLLDLRYMERTMLIQRRTLLSRLISLLRLSCNSQATEKPSQSKASHTMHVTSFYTNVIYIPPSQNRSALTASCQFMNLILMSAMNPKSCTTLKLCLFPSGKLVRHL